MRFYCPKCDLKYRIDDDKLAEQPNAQMRCKGCHAVFSVQAAVKLGNDRKADGRPPVDGAPNLSLPPPKPSPMAWKSTVPVAPSAAGKGVVTMPLLDVTARPRIEPSKQGSPKGGAATKPGLAPNTRGLLIGPKIGQRGSGATSLLSAKSLRGAGERPSLPQIKLTSERPTKLESARPVQVLGRGSAAGFPPVTEERTHPVVPRLPRVAKETLVESELAQPVSVGPASVQAALAQAVVAEPELADSSDDEREFGPDGFELDEVAPDVDDHEDPSDELDSELLLIESVPPLTPVMVSDARAVPAEAEASWTEADGPLGFSLTESEPLALEILAEPARETGSKSAFDQVRYGAGVGQGSRANFVGSESSRWDSTEPSLSRPPPRSGVSLAVAMIVSLLCAAAGFTGGFFAGSKSERSLARPEAAALVQVPTVRAPNDPPPPPPDQEPAASQELAASESGVLEHVSRSKLSARSGDVRALASGNGSSSNSGNGALPLDGLSNLGAGLPEGPQSGSKPSVGSESGLGESSIQATVQRFQPSIRRMCWQPALSRHGGESGGARVSTTVTIAPAGKVTAVAHEGDPAGYPGLASCIAVRVKTWKFQRASAPTTVKIPFVFAAQ